MQLSTKIILIFITFIVLILGVFARYYHVAFADREINRVLSKDRDKAKRGSIISADGYRVAYTRKVYTAEVNTRDIPKQNENIFAQMFSLYSGMPKDIILDKIRSKNGNVRLANHLTFQQYQGIKELAKEFTSSGILVGKKNSHNGRYKYIGLSIRETGAEREYPYGNTLTPLIGYTNHFVEKQYGRVTGIKGLEETFENDMQPTNDGFIRGNKDIRGNIILNSSVKRRIKIDGSDVHLNIDIGVQKRIELLLTKKQNEFQSKQIIASVMESDTGNLIALATTNRFIRKSLKHISYLNIDAVEYVFEPGSVIKPVIYSLLLDAKKIRRGQHINCENGKYRIGRKVITDEHRMGLIPVEEVIIESSNIGMSKLVKDFDALEFHNGLKLFGFGQRTGLEIGREITGSINTPKELSRHIYRATASYGYGFTVNFMQLLKAFNIFNNDGTIVNPKAVSYLKNGDVVISDIERNSPIADGTKIISSSTSRKMKNILVRTVKEGTGRSANIIGLEIGGKTGTAHIAKNGGYENKYHSSFFGFANDKARKYTIGVTVIDPEGRKYFASKTAVPIFKSIVNILVDEKYLQKFYSN